MTPLYQRILGPVWAELPAAIREMHDGVSLAAGEADVERGRHPLAWIGAVLMGFPAAGKAKPLRVQFDYDERGETWTREFAEARFSSRQYAGRDHLLCEQFGVMAFAMALVLRDGELQLHTRNWRAFGVPLPLWLAPRSRAYESAEDGVFRFFVEISHPLCGLIVRYNGWLKP